MEEEQLRRPRVILVLEICVDPAQQLVVGELEMVAVGGVKVELSGFIQLLETKPIFLVPWSVLHIPCSIKGAVLVEAKVLRLGREHHSVAHSAHQQGRVELVQVLGIRLILGELGRFLVPVSQTMATSAVLIQVLWVTEVVGLGEVVLDKLVVSSQVQKTVQLLADLGCHFALGDTGNTHDWAVDGYPVEHWRIVDLVDVTTDDIVTLRVTDGIETVGEVLISLHDGGKASD
mmetsp:Transcript_22454/g.44853  ORF Transcript_22454/g.44853 Transcript_22454/m.44853 type:complete len:232 (-) Transcript_22454:388-1083(-)